MNIPRETIEKGEALLMSENVIEFEKLVKEGVPVPEHDEFMEQVQTRMDNGNIRGAIRIWHLLCQEAPVQMDYVGGVLRIGWDIIKVLGAIGGLWFLIDRLMDLF